MLPLPLPPPAASPSSESNGRRRTQVLVLHQSPRAQRALRRRFLDLSLAQRARMGRRCLVRRRRKKARAKTKSRRRNRPPPPKRGRRRASRKGTAGVHRYHPISLLLAPLAPPNSPLSTHVITRSGLFRRPLDGSSSFGLHRSSEKEIRGGLDLTFPLFLPSPLLRRWFSSFLSFSCCA